MSNYNPMLDDEEDEAPRGLPVNFPKVRSAPASRGIDTTFSEIFDDDEPILSDMSHEDRKRFTYGEPGDKIIALLEARQKKLRNDYPGGGWRAYQLINMEILEQMPKGWLERFSDDVADGTRWTQQQLASRDRSDAIADAQNNPTEDKYQDAAFRAVQGILTEYLDRKNYRGTDRLIMMNLVASEIIGLSVIDPIWRAADVEEIIVNGPKDVQIGVGGQYRRIPAAQFRDAAHVLQMLERIFSSINKTLSPKTPMLRGRLHDQSRIYAVHPYVAPEGPNVNIRRHPDKYWTAEDLVRRGSMSDEIATWLGNMIYKGCSFVVIGATSTGKTSFLNAMTGFYRDDVRLVTLEQNLEMKPHPNKMLAAAMEAKESITGNPNEGVTMRDLVKGSIQGLAPNGIIIGEVTDGAAYDLVQALNTGHFGTSTIHANSEFDGIYRIASLVQQGGDVTQDQALPLIAAAFDFIILLEHFPEDGSRRVTSISEVDPYPTLDKNGRNTLGVNQLFKFVADGKKPDADGDMKIYGHWEKTGEFSELRSERRHLNLIPDLSWEQLKAISSIPEGS